MGDYMYIINFVYAHVTFVMSGFKLTPYLK